MISLNKTLQNEKKKKKRVQVKRVTKKTKKKSCDMEFSS